MTKLPILINTKLKKYFNIEEISDSALIIDIKKEWK
jgi:hypothetical protein